MLEIGEPFIEKESKETYGILEKITETKNYLTNSYTHDKLQEGEKRRILLLLGGKSPERCADR